MNSIQTYSDIKSGFVVLTKKNLIELIESCYVVHPMYNYNFKYPTLCILDDDVQKIDIKDLDKSFNLIKVMNPIVPSLN